MKTMTKKGRVKKEKMRHTHNIKRDRVFTTFAGSTRADRGAREEVVVEMEEVIDEFVARELEGVVGGF